MVIFEGRIFIAYKLRYRNICVLCTHYLFLEIHDTYLLNHSLFDTFLTPHQKGKGKTGLIEIDLLVRDRNSLSFYFQNSLPLLETKILLFPCLNISTNLSLFVVMTHTIQNGKFGCMILSKLWG